MSHVSCLRSCLSVTDDVGYSALYDAKTVQLLFFPGRGEDGRKDGWDGWMDGWMVVWRRSYCRGPTQRAYHNIYLHTCPSGRQKPAKVNPNPIVYIVWNLPCLAIIVSR